MPNDLVSIIIPCYNQAQYLEEAVESAVNQTYPNIEIIIVDDGSSDNSKEVALELEKKYPDKIQIISQKNSGVSKARNNAIRQSQGQYILPLDGDDKLYIHMVEKCIYLAKKNNTDIIYTGYQGFGTAKKSNLWQPFEETNPLYMTPCSVTALYKKEVWETSGGYSDLMHDGYEDWEFWVNAYKHNFKFKHIPEKLFFYRIKGESRDTNSYLKDAYLKAKIVILHPEMYPHYRVQSSIDIIKKTEGLADLYFYTAKEITLDEKQIELIISNYLTGNKLQLEQSIDTSDQTIELYSLENQDTIRTMEELLKNTQNVLIIFYSQILYNIPKLKSFSSSWVRDKGMVGANGTVFPYVFKSIRQDPDMQNIACERLERFEAFNQGRIRNFLKHADVSNKKLSHLDLLMESLEELTQQSSWRNPIQKIKAYKKLLSFYHTYRPARITIQKNNKHIIFIIDPAMKHTQIAFYLYENDKHVDTQWYSKNFSYKLDKKRYEKGEYRIRYFIVSENTDDPGNAKKEESGYSEYIEL